MSLGKEGIGPLFKGDTMPEFTVCMREVWIQKVKIEAKDKEEAIELVAGGGGNHLGAPGGLKYDHVLDTDCWTFDD